MTNPGVADRLLALFTEMSRAKLTVTVPVAKNPLYTCNTSPNRY